MPNTTISALALTLSIVLPAIAGAQTPPTNPTPTAQQPGTPTTKTEKPTASTQPGEWTYLVSGSIGGQFGSHDFATNTQYTLYDEPGTVQSTGKVKSGLAYDASVAYKLTPTFGVSVGFSYFSSKSDASVTADVPHPIFFDTFRVVNTTASGLKTSAPALNLDGVWFIPFTTELDFTVSAGPSIVFAKQDVVSGVTVVQPEQPPYESPQIDTVSTSSNSKTTLGFNVGADAIYRLTPQYGVGVTLRYLYANPDISGTTDHVNVGGFQLLGGVRVKF